MVVYHLLKNEKIHGSDFLVLPHSGSTLERVRIVYGTNNRVGISVDHRLPSGLHTLPGAYFGIPVVVYRSFGRAYYFGFHPRERFWRWVR